MGKTIKYFQKIKVLLNFKIQKIFLQLIIFLFCSTNLYSQCNPPIDIPFSLVELDSVINYNFTSSVTGIDFTQPLNLNLPLCPEYAEEGAGCTQVELPVIDYNGLGLGYSSATSQVFWRDIWENQLNAEGDLIFLDSDDDGCAYDDSDAPFALTEYGISESDIEAGFSTDWNGDGTMDFAVVILYFCEDDTNTPQNEEENVCGCNVEFFSINESNDFQLNYDQTNVSCYESGDAIINTTSTGGVGPFIYNWDFIEDTFSIEGDLIDEGQVVENLSPGGYNLIVQDLGIPCTYTYDFLVTEPDSFAVQSVLATDPSCYGLSDGSAELIVTGGTPPYSQEALIPGLGAGDYEIFISDANGCEASTSFNLTAPPQIEIISTISNYNGYNVACFLDSNAAITIESVFGGSSNIYSFSWSTGDTTSSISSLSAGFYDLTITDDQGCEEDFVFEIVEPDSLTISNIVSSYNDFGVSCSGADDGFIDVTVEGGTGFYSYEWSNGSTNQDLVDIGAGFYSLTVIDSNGCSISIDADIIEPTELVISSVVSDYNGFGVSCFGATDGFVDVTVEGGTGEYTYLWSNGAATEDVDNLSPGNYALTVSDENSCTVSLLVTITEPESLEIILDPSSVLELSCGDDTLGQIDISINGGFEPFSYNWNTGDTVEDISGLGVGFYIVDVTDANGCTDTLSIEIQAPGTLLVSDPVINYCNDLDNPDTVEIECGGEVLIETISGGFSSDYEIAVINPSGDVEIITVSSSDGSSISYSASNLCNGNYIISVVDSNNCTVSYSYDILYGEIQAPSTDLFINNLLIEDGETGFCTGDAANISALTTGGAEPYSYTWLDGSGNIILNNSSNITINEIGDYSVTTTNMAGCSVTNFFNVVELENLNINTGFDAVCPGQDSYLYTIGQPSGGEGPYFYEWYYDIDQNGFDNNDPLIDSGSDVTFVGVSSFGDYYLVVSDVNGCNITQPITINWALDIGLDTESIVSTCFSECEGSITLVPDGSINSFDFANWELYYSIADIDNDGLNNLDENGVVLDPDIDGDGILNEEDEDIDGDGVLNVDDNLTSVSVYSQLVESPAFLIDSLCAGEYYMIGLSTTGDGCETLIDFFEIPEYDDLSIDSITTADISCFGNADGVVEINVSGGSLSGQTYDLELNGTSVSSGLISDPIVVSDLGPGDYNFIVIDSECQDVQESFLIIEPDDLVISVDSVFSELVCFGDTSGFIDLSVTGGVPPYSYSWDNGFENEDIFNLSSGTYILTVTDSINCIETFTQEIVDPDDFLVTSIFSNVTCYGAQDGTIDLEIQGPGTYSYIWSNGSVEEDLSDLGPGVYTVDIFSDLDCGQETLEFEINEPDEIEITIEDVQSSSCFSFTFNNGSIDINVIGGSGSYSYNWISEGASFESFDEDISNLSAGFYTLTVLDSDGCEVIYPEEIQITEPSPIEFFEDLDNNGFINSSFNYTENICSASCDGQISLDLGGGVAPFNIELLNSDGEFIQQNGSGIFNGLCSDCYVINIYDANWDENTPNECVTVLDLCINESNPSINADIIPSGCNIDGVASFDLIDGIFPYDISVYLNNSLYAEEIGYESSNIVFDNLPSGSFEFVVEDSIGCESIYSFDLENIINEIEVVSIDVLNPNCPDDLGVADIEFSNTFTLDSSDTFGFIYIVEDLNGDCVYDLDDVVLQAIDIENTSGSNINLQLTDIDEGEYLIYIEDIFGCATESCFSVDGIIEPDPNNFFASVDAICANGSGSAYVSGDPLDMGGTPFDTEPFYIVEWFDSNDNPVTTITEDALVATSLFAGDYTVFITDANNCIYTHDFVISEPPSVLVSGISYSDSNCAGSCAGEIVIQPFGGVGDFYTIIITPSGQPSLPAEVVVPGINDTFILPNLCAGDYQIEVFDDVCPSVFENITISEPNPIEWTIEIEPLPCNGDVVVWSDGPFGDNYYTYEGGIGPPDLYWFAQGESLTLGNEEDINNLGPGIYDLLSIDAAGCETVHGPITIPETPELNSDFNPFDSSLWIYCPGDNTGSIAFNTYGGTPESGPYTYLWEFNGEYLPEFDNENVLNNLFAGEYQITVDDENGCGPIIHNLIIQEPEELVVDIDQSDYNGYGVSCFGYDDGYINVTATGGLNPNDSSYGYTYQWSGVSFNGDNIDLSNQDTSEDLFNLEPGAYSLSMQINIPNSNDIISSCQYSTEILISEPLELEIEEINIDDVTCNGYSDGAIDISVEGGVMPYSFTWSAVDFEGDIINLGLNVSNEDLTNLTAGIYTVSIEDVNSCGPITETINVNEPSVLSSNLSNNVLSITNARCSFGNTDSGQIAIHVESLFSQISGGTEPYSNPYMINDGSIQNGTILGDTIYFSNLSGGNYDIYLNDALDCEILFTVTVDIDNQNEIELGVITENATCNDNGSVLINSIQNFDGIPPFNITISNINDPSYVYSFTTYGGFDYNSNDWNNNQVIDFDPDIDGDGLFNELDGDIDGDSIENYLDDTVFGEEGGDVDNDGIVNFDLDFNGADFGIYQSAPAGEYMVSIVDSVGCEGVAGPFVIIEETPSFAVSTEPGSCYWSLENTCDDLTNNGSIVINPNSFINNTIYPYYLILDGEPYDTISDWGTNNDGLFNEYIIDSLEAGTAYSISLTDANGCYFSNNGDYYEVPFLSETNIDIVGFCPECEESRNGGFAYTFLGINDEVLYGSIPESYEISIDPLNYMDNDISIDIMLSNNNISDCITNPNILDTIANNDELLDDTELYFVDESFLDEIPDPNVLVDYHQDYLNLLTDTTDYAIGGLSHGIYYVTMVDQYGCQYTEEIDISSQTCTSEFGSTQWNNCLFIPSVFTPNGDNINDLWDIYNIELYEPGVNVKIFNRWGQIVYETNGEYSNDLWNGVNLKGKDVEIATYYYVIELEGYDKNYTGYVVVKR